MPTINTRPTPIFGGVRDGDIIPIPENAENGFEVRLEQNTAKTTPGQRSAFSDYALREDPRATPPRALVLAGMKWPILAREAGGAR